MNKIFEYIGCATLSILALGACSPEEFEGANPDLIPTISGYSIVLNVDQETNTATFSLSGDLTGCYPVWYLDGSNYSVLPEASYTSLAAGTHSLEVYLMNRNGMSQAALESSFTFNNTIVDYTQYFNRLCDKEWRIDYSEAGHMGCGESGSDGSNWWSAGVNEKADYGVYDDRVTFSHSDSDAAAAGTYTYDPGEGGTVYVNYGCVTFNTTGATEDFMMETSAQTAGFEFVNGTYNDEDCLYLQFDPYTLLPYIPNDAIYANPYYRIEALTNTRLAIVCDEGSIAWRLVFTSREDTGLAEEGEEASYDWDYDSSANMWKTVDEGDYTVDQWFADNNWNQISDASWSKSGDEWTITIPEGIGGSQWQGQFSIATSLSASASKAYNVYLLMEPDNDCSGVTIKLTDASDDDNYFFADRHDMTADKQNVFKAEGATLSAGYDAAALKLFFDFGGTPGGTVVKISKIYIEEAVGYNDDKNLWKTVDDEGSYTVDQWFADNNWNQISNASWSQSGSQWKITLPDGMGGSQWQGQFLITTALSASMSSSYTFSCTITPDNDLSQMTIKLTDSTSDDNYFFADRHDFTADKDNVYKVTGAVLNTSDINGTLKLVLDFGGSPSGTNVVVSDIIFYEE